MSYTFHAPPKDPAAILRHGIDWSAWLDHDETISTRTVVPAQDGITVDQLSDENGIVTYRISGGKAGKNYIVTCRITTNTGRSDERSVRYPVRER